MKQGVKLRKFHPPLNANVFFCRLFFNLTLCMTKLRVPILSFPDFADISYCPQVATFTQCVPADLPKYGRIVFQNLLSSLTCSRIWLIPLVADRHWGYITKLKNKTMEMISTIWDFNSIFKNNCFSLRWLPDPK
jgi:hypothetical protein